MVAWRKDLRSWSLIWGELVTVDQVVPGVFDYLRSWSLIWREPGAVWLSLPCFS